MPIQAKKHTEEGFSLIFRVITKCIKATGFIVTKEKSSSRQAFIHLFIYIITMQITDQNNLKNHDTIDNNCRFHQIN